MTYTRDIVERQSVMPIDSLVPELKDAQALLTFHTRRRDMWQAAMMEWENKTGDVDYKKRHHDAQFCYDEHAALVKSVNAILGALGTLAEMFRGDWINADDVRRSTKIIDTALNGAFGAARPSLCDVAAQMHALASAGWFEHIQRHYQTNRLNRPLPHGDGVPTPHVNSNDEDHQPEPSQVERGLDVEGGQGQQDHGQNHQE
jgi:hypothetical protein